MSRPIVTAFEPAGEQADHWRFQFCQAVSEVAPEVWNDLCASVYPTYKLARSTEGAGYRYHDEIRGMALLSRRSKDRMPGVFRSLVHLLNAWQIRWRLTETWCERYALMSMNTWLIIPELERTVPASYGWGGVMLYLEPPELPAWNPSTSWTVYECEMHKLLKAYQKRSEEYLEAHNWRVKARPSNDVPWKHLCWLALAVTKGLRPGEIETHELTAGRATDESTIRKAIKQTARRIGFDGMANV